MCLKVTGIHENIKNGKFTTHLQLVVLPFLVITIK